MKPYSFLFGLLGTMIPMMIGYAIAGTPGQIAGLVIGIFIVFVVTYLRVGWPWSPRARRRL